MLVVGLKPEADDTRVRRNRSGRTRLVPAKSINAGFACRRRPGEVGNVVGTPVPLASSVLASGTRGCSRSEDGRASRPIALKHGVEESDRLGEESSARRSEDSEQGLALKFNRFLNPYGGAREGRKIMLIQRFVKYLNHCVEDHEFAHLRETGLCSTRQDAVRLAKLVPRSRPGKAQRLSSWRNNAVRTSISVADSGTAGAPMLASGRWAVA